MDEVTSTIDRWEQMEDLVGAEWTDWYRLTPAERFLESMKLWETYLALGGSLEPEPDTQSPFFDPQEWRENAAQFSRDLDLLVLADPANFALLREALTLLSADPIEVPELQQHFLDRGHAVHFRCQMEAVRGLRIDVMSKLRGTDDFDLLSSRRTTILVQGEDIDLLSLRDLVKAKKTQRDKDWPMIRRLMEQASLWEGPTRGVAIWNSCFSNCGLPSY